MGDGCTCQRCGTLFLVDVLVPDELWEQIKPDSKSTGGGLLCGWCVIDALERRGHGAYEVKAVP